LAGGNKEATPEASDIPEQPREAAKDAVSAVKEATSINPEEAAKDAASAAKDVLPEAPKELPNPFQGFFSGLCPLHVEVRTVALLAAMSSSNSSSDQVHRPIDSYKPHVQGQQHIMKALEAGRSIPHTRIGLCQ